MFHRRASEFEPSVSAIVDHLRAIEDELGAIGKNAGRRASTQASAAGGQIAEALAPLLNELGSRFRRGQRVAVDEAASFGNEALRLGSRAGSDALSRIAYQARHRPLFTLAVAVGVGVLIGFAGRRD
jgi:ElaB/YqjD/DUF883 family membrane-anchored ribosome-binding protein